MTDGDAVAWVIAYPGKKGARHLWCLCGTSVLAVTDDSVDVGKVFMWGFVTIEGATTYCVDHLRNAEDLGARLGLEPVFFWLPPVATAEIVPRAGGWWINAPLLYRSLYGLMPRERS